MDQKSSGGESQRTTSKHTARSELSISDIEWGEVNAIYNLQSEFTDMQKDEEWKRFKGKKVKWSGTVASVSESWGSVKLQVKMNPDTWTSDLLITLEPDQKQNALKLGKEAPVSFTGILDSWGTLMPITLKDGHILVSGEASSKNQTTPTGQPEGDETRPEPATAPPIADITWEEVNVIYNLQSGYTEMQKKEEWKIFIGKRVKWSGTVADVSESWGSIALQVKMNPDTWTSDLLIRLRPDQKANALALGEGAAVTFTGILDSWGTLMPITLKDGSIVTSQ